MSHISTPSGDKEARRFDSSSCEPPLLAGVGIPGSADIVWSAQQGVAISCVGAPNMALPGARLILLATPENHWTKISLFDPVARCFFMPALDRR